MTDLSTDIESLEWQEAGPDDQPFQQHHAVSLKLLKPKRVG